MPQGSVLGPVLFAIFINDLPHAIDSSLKIFADDTKVYRKVACVTDFQTLQDDINRVAEWSDCWQLPFNESKCKTLHIGTRNRHSSYTMRNSELAHSLVERDLGVLVDSELKFRQQAAAAVAKASQVLAVIRRSFEKLDKSTLPLLYKALIRPHLEYANAIWGRSIEPISAKWNVSSGEQQGCAVKCLTCPTRNDYELCACPHSTTVVAEAT